MCLSAGVILFTHPVHSLLALITIFFAVVVLYLSAGAEFLAFTFLIVYVGAVAILFLFVIRLLNVKELTSSARQQLGNAQWLACFLAAFAVPHTRFDLKRNFGVYAATRVSDLPITASRLADYVTEQHRDVMQISALLYTHYSQLFILTTLLLLTARLGAIVLASGTMHAEK